MKYRAPFILFNRHLETIFPALVRNVDIKAILRERIDTPDNDFIDADWYTQSSPDLLIVSHGLEGNSERAYVKGMARHGLANNFDVLAWNFRGCSGEINQQQRFYHSGATDDLETVIQHALQQNRYDRIFLLGFSLGGNLTLKYLGEERQRPSQLTGAVAFSVPMQLESSCEKISRPSNWVYSFRFLRNLKKKVVQKSKAMSVPYDLSILREANTLKEFDDRITAPVHGFTDAHDYYTQNSSLQFLTSIQIPTLIVNAKNDPFLSDECYPIDLLRNHPFVKLECPDRGGHVGFTLFNKNGVYWSERRAMEFFSVLKSDNV